jgi:ketosteroid isomerase-like protein
VADHATRLASLFPAYNDEGVEAILSVFRPDVTWMAPPEWMDQPVYCGHEGIRDLDALWRANFDEFRLELEEMRAVGPRLVALLFLRGRIKGSTQEIEQRASWVVDFDADGLITRLAAFFSWDEALEVAGAA